MIGLEILLLIKSSDFRFQNSKPILCASIFWWELKIQIFPHQYHEDVMFFQFETQHKFYI